MALVGGGGYAGTVRTGSWLWWEGRLCRYCRDRVIALVGGGGYAGTVGTGSLL